MAPPAVLHQNSHRSPTLSASSDASGVPLRHPRPLTAAELYLECEKEQEAVVNRLTRELTALRAQSASVASNASHSSTSTSASLLPIDISDPNPTHQMTGATHPTPSRRHRSSSSLSTRSIPTPSTSVASSSILTNTSTQGQPSGSTGTSTAGGISQASADRAAAIAPSTSTSRRNTSTAPLSRQPSITATASGTSTPARQSLDIARHPQHSRPPLSRDASYSTAAAQPQSPALPNTTTSTAFQHYADTTAYRTEMEIVKAENDTLRQRVRALEGALRESRRRRDSSHEPSARVDREGGGAVEGRGGTTASWAANVGGVAGPRQRSESQSTTASLASSRRGGGGGGGVALEDEVRVGESASSLRGG